MDELLQHLEKQIKDLIGRHSHLAEANQQLKQNKSLLSREKDTLLFKQQKAITQIEALLAKLKTLELAPEQSNHD